MLGEVDLFLCGMSGRTTKFRREISYLVFFFCQVGYGLGCHQSSFGGYPVQKRFLLPIFASSFPGFIASFTQQWTVPPFRGRQPRSPRTTPRAMAISVQLRGTKRGENQTQLCHFEVPLQKTNIVTENPYFR